MNQQAAPIRQLIRQAQAQSERGQYAAAVASYRLALQHDPGQPETWFNLAWCLRRCAQPEQALDAYAQAIRHGIEAPEEAELNRAVILTDDLQRHEEAEAALRSALRLRPSYLQARLNLGNLLEELGRREEAVGCYREMQQATAAPGSPDAALVLEASAREIRLLPAADFDPVRLARLQQQAEQPGVAPQLAAQLQFAVGEVLDRQGDWDAAFAAYASANTHARSMGPPYDPSRLQRIVTGLDARLAALAGSLPDVRMQPRPLFVLGMFRSGSTLLEQVLNAHPAIAAGGELHFFPQAAARLLSLPVEASDAIRAAVAGFAGDYGALLARLTRSLCGETAGGLRWFTDKRPDNFMLIPLIRAVLPQARVIHTLRHPLDNGLSVYFQHLDQRVAPYSTDLAAIGHHYGEYRRLMADFASRWPDLLIEFDYDQFVHDPEPALRKLLAALDLPWDERCLRFHDQRNAVKTASYWQVRRPLYRASSGRWRHYAPHLQPLVQALQSSGVPIAEWGS